jgi:hypothetical protein
MSVNRKYGSHLVALSTTSGNISEIMPGLAGPAGRFTDRSGVGSVVLGKRRYVDIEPEKVGRRTAWGFRKFQTVSGLPCRVVAARRPVRPVTLAPIRRAGWSEAARQRSPEDVGHPTAARSVPVDLPAEQCLEADACLGGSPVRVHAVANVYARSRYAGSVSTRMMSSATASTCHRASGSHSASPRACIRRALSGRSAPCASTTCGVQDAIAAARRPSRPAPIAKTARVAAAGRRCSRCTQPCRHPLPGRDQDLAPVASRELVRAAGGEVGRYVTDQRAGRAWSMGTGMGWESLVGIPSPDFVVADSCAQLRVRIESSADCCRRGMSTAPRPCRCRCPRRSRPGRGRTERR